MTPRVELALLLLTWALLAAATLLLILQDHGRLNACLIAWSGGWISCLLLQRFTRWGAAR